MRREVEERERAQRELRTAKEAADTANQAKERLPREHEPRAAYAAERGHRVLGVAGAGDLRRAEHQAAHLREERARVGPHLLQLVNDILDISKVEAGRMDLDVRAHADRQHRRRRPQRDHAVAGKKGIELDVDMPQSLPDVFIDPGRIKQVLYNLIATHQVHAARRYGPRLGARRREARGRPGGRHGVGIAKEDLPRLFREFEQLRSRRRAPEGTGLGLALTRRSSSCTAARSPSRASSGKGSTFSVFLPVEVPRRDHVDQAPGRVPGNPVSSSSSSSSSTPTKLPRTVRRRGAPGG
jgi:signal transduction histidine kinase